MWRRTLEISATQEPEMEGSEARGQTEQPGNTLSQNIIIKRLRACSLLVKHFPSKYRAWIQFPIESKSKSTQMRERTTKNTLANYGPRNRLPQLCQGPEWGRTDPLWLRRSWLGRGRWGEPQNRWWYSISRRRTQISLQSVKTREPLCSLQRSRWEGCWLIME